MVLKANIVVFEGTDRSRVELRHNSVVLRHFLVHLTLGNSQDLRLYTAMLGWCFSDEIKRIRRETDYVSIVSICAEHSSFAVVHL
jgi:hypothetical protein